jgi:SHS2 domain-containing protein
MADRPTPPRRRIPKTYTEAEHNKLVGEALAAKDASEQAKATHDAVGQLKGEFTTVKAQLQDVSGKVEEGNSLKREILTVQEDLVERVAAHHTEVEAFTYPDWSIEEKLGLRPSVVDYLTRARTRFALATTGRRRLALAGLVIAALALLVTAVGTIFNVIHGMPPAK